MKTVTAKQDFKVVKDTIVKRFPELSDRVGKKRETVSFELPVYEASDLPELTAQHGGLILDCFNNALANLAKDLFAAESANWDFVPSLDMLSPAALAASFETQSKGRLLTLESAGKLAAWITRNLSAVVAEIKKADENYSAAQLSAICVVIGKFTAYEAKSADYLNKVLLRLEQISEAIGNNEALAESFIQDDSLPAVYDALVKRFSKNIETEIDADAL